MITHIYDKQVSNISYHIYITFIFESSGLFGAIKKENNDVLKYKKTFEASSFLDTSFSLK